MAYQRFPIPLARLRLNKENDRHGVLPSEPDCIAWMLEHLGDEIRNLAADIAEHGLSPIDGVLVVPDPDTKGDYIVWEGNRRITALKLLDNPDRCEDPKLRRKFAAIRGKAKIDIPRKVECTVADSIEEADWPIELRHQGYQEGVGTIPWDAMQKSRHLQRLGKKGRYAFTHLVVDSVLEKLDEDLRAKVTGKGFKISTLDRLLKNPEVREFLGISNADGVPRRFLHETEVLKGITKVLQDIADGMPVRDVYDAKKQKEYVSSFPPENTPNQQREVKDSRPMVPPARPAQVPAKVRALRPSHQRKHMIPSGVQYSIKDKRLRAIFRELQDLELNQHRNAVSVLFRVFVELSVELYLEHNSVNYHDGDNLSKKSEKAATHMEQQNWASKHELKGIKAAISSPHNPLSFNTFNAYVHNRHFHPTGPDLATAWDNVQSFLDVLYAHL